LEEKAYNFTYRNIYIHFYKYEGGPKKLICFHGFGQQASDLKNLAARLAEHYTIYSIDLFYHGKSSWPDCEKALTKGFWNELFNAFLTYNRIDQYSLCGYSLGGKIVLSILESTVKSPKEVLLIAPDGIQTNLWYSLATYPYWMKRTFKYAVQHPGFYHRFSKILQATGILDKGIIKFANNQMSTETKRKKVYCTWLVYRKLKPDLVKVVENQRNKNIPVKVFLGKYDRMINQKKIEAFLSTLSQHKLTILPKGHNTLISDVAEYEGNIF